MLNGLSAIPKIVQDGMKSYGMGGAAMVVAGVIQRQWGMAAAVSFVVGVVVNYPLLIGRVEVLPHVDVSYLVQAGVACSIPVLYFYYPVGAPMYIPMVCTALALAILKQMWDQAVLVRQLSEQNKEFARLEKEFREAAGTLEVAVGVCLGQSAQMESIGEKHDAAAAVVDAIDKRLSALNVKILGLVKVCEGARSAETVLARLRTVGEADNNLARLSSECHKRQAELERLNREITTSKDELRGIIRALSADQFRLRKDLVELEQKLSEIVGKGQ